MFKKIKQKIKQWKCHHTVDVKRWHWTHGPNGNDPAFVEIEYQCEVCNKITYLYLKGKEATEWANSMGDYKKQ